MFILIITTENGYKRFKDERSTVSNLFGETSIFSQEGVTLLNEAYSSVNSGERFQMPEDISSIEQARDSALRKMEEARKELKQGKIGDSVRSLLEVAIIVVTPMRRDHQES